MPHGTAVDLYESVTRPVKRRVPRQLKNARPRSADDIAAILTNPEKFPSPVRPVGSGSSITRCNQTAAGTTVDMTALDRVLGQTRNTVTVQAGMRLRDLAEHLAQDNLELVGDCSDPNRTVGGAISSGALGGGLPGDGSQLASSVCHITLINGLGKRVEIGENLPDLLLLARMSYGLLGIVYSATLRIRPIRSYTIRNTKVDFDEFVCLLPNLMEVNAAVKVSLMPFRDRAYIEVRYPDEVDRKAAALPRKLRDWATNSAVPKVIRSVGKVVPVRNLRDPLIDGLTEATHVLSNKLVGSGSNSAEQTGSFKKLVLDEEIGNCTWLFSIANLASVIPAFRKFCERHYRSSGFRCDLPAEARRIDRDQYALLSPSFDGPLFALTVRSTNLERWDDFLLEFAEFAVHFKGIPLFNQTRGIKPRYAVTAYGDRLQRFRDIRKRLDPENRLLSQFFSEHLG